MSPFKFRSLRSSLLVFTLLMCGSVGAWVVTPCHTMGQTTSLAKSVPGVFGDWRETTSVLQQIPLSVVSDGNRTEEQPYDEVLMRTYSNSKGEKIMLALAYAREQKQEVKIHRPEVCYVAQGYKVLAEQHSEFPQTRGHGIPGQRLLMAANNRLEAVSYWIRIGADYPRGSVNTRITILQHGFRGIVPDAILVRASSILAVPGDAASGFELQERFLAELVQAMRPVDATMLVATKN